MLKRFLLRSLVLAGILLACFAHLVWNGWQAKKIVAENLPHPSLSTGKRDIDLSVPTYEPGRLYDLTFERGEETGGTLPADARLKVQLTSNGRTRLLVVRSGHPNTDVSWWALLTGREKLQIVADREWIDLGPAPQPGETFEVQVSGLLPGPYGFAQIFTHDRPHFSLIRAVRPESPRARITRTTLRYAFQRAEPVPARETLARFFFFISCSRVLQVTGLVAIVLLFAGWWWLWEKRYSRAVAALVPAITLIHACCLAPFQGADEAFHVGTVEAVVWDPAMFAHLYSYPSSLGLLYDVIGYDKWVRYPEIPVPIDSPERRAQVRDVAASRLEAEARTGGPAHIDAYLLNPRMRAPLYYNAFRIPGPLLRKMSVLDRLEGYVVLSAAMSLLLFGLGLLFLVRTCLSENILLLYGLVALVPYSVGVVASCSNYSPAIGLGAFLAACALVAVLSLETGPRRLAGSLFVGASALGIGVWDDFAFLALAGGLAFLGAEVARLLGRADGREHSSARLLTFGVAVALIGLGAWGLWSGRAFPFLSSLAARRPQSLGGPEDPTFWVLLAAAAVPFVVSLLFALFLLLARAFPETQRLAWAWSRTAGGAALFLVLFLATSYSSVPFENTRLDLPDEIAAHWSSFWSNNFSWDQDVLFWKMYWGSFGYADVFYPPAIYALARWLCVGLFLALPVLNVRFTSKRPVASAQLLLVSGFALSVCILTNGIRHLQPSLPWGRFILPLLPLAALPALARTDALDRERWWRAVTFAAVALHLWTALTVLGSRYAVGG